jgi:5'-nucleotidase
LARAIHARAGADSAAYEGCDIILGGHDHFYYVSKVGPGSTSWEGYDVNSPCLGAEEDDGVLVIKSGTDFRDLSEIQLDIEESPRGSVRKCFISAIKGEKSTFIGSLLNPFPVGTRHSTKPDSKPSQKVSELLEKVVGHIEGSLSKPICKLDAELDCRSDVVRVAEVSLVSTRFMKLILV